MSAPGLPADATQALPEPADGRARKAPRRLRARIIRLPANTDWRARLAAAEAAAEAEFRDARAPAWSQTFRASSRIAAAMVWTVLGFLVQPVLLACGRATGKWGARIYHAVLARIFGLRLRRLGRDAQRPPSAARLRGLVQAARRRGKAPPAITAGRRPVIYVANHQSWLDIVALGGLLGAAFVAKEEVGTWPLIRTVARLGRTLYVSRRRQATGAEANLLKARLSGGDSLILFPEGTTNDGGRVLPFRSAFLALAESPEPPLIQPVTLVYDRLDGLPVGKKHHALFAWVGDVSIARHAWALLGHQSFRATVVFHPVIDPKVTKGRKALAEACHRTVALAAAQLRQGRQPSAIAPVTAAIVA